MRSCLQQFLNLFISPSLMHLKRAQYPPPPSTHVCWNKKIPCLVGQDWHSVQMSKQLKPCLTLPVPVLTFPISITSRTVRGIVSGEWWRTEPFRHQSSEGVTRLTHQAISMIIKCSHTLHFKETMHSICSLLRSHTYRGKNQNVCRNFSNCSRNIIRLFAMR